MFKKILIGLMLLASPAVAATTPNSFITPQKLTRGFASFAQGVDAAGTYKTLYTAGADGSRCYGIWSSNSDSVGGRALYVTLFVGSSGYGGSVISSNANAGNAPGVPAQNLMSPSVWPGLPVDQYGNPYIQLAAGDFLKATFNTSLATGSVVTFIASCADF